MKPGSLFIFGILILSTLACVVPGASQPAPIDPSTLPTMVVLTVNAATTQTAAASFSGQVPPAGEIASATPLPLNETSLEPQPNGSVKFTHISGGYEITYPTGWLTVRPNSEEFNAAYANDAPGNPILMDQMNYDLSTYEAGYDQLYSYALRPDIDQNYMFGFSTLKWDSQDTQSLNEATMGELARGLESSGAVPGFRVDTAQIYENSNGVEIIEIGGQFSLSDGQGGLIPFYVTVIFFKPTASSITRITFTYLKDYKLELSPDVTDTIVSIRLLGQ